MPPPGFKWREDKNRRNIREHKIDFNDAVRIFDGPMLEQIDDREEYGEERVNTLGLLDGRVVLNVTYTEREGKVRLISARPAKNSEREEYRDFMRGRYFQPKQET